MKLRIEKDNIAKNNREFGFQSGEKKGKFHNFVKTALLISRNFCEEIKLLDLRNLHACGLETKNSFWREKIS